MDKLDDVKGTCYMKKRYANAQSITAEMARERSDCSIKIKIEEELASVYGNIYNASGKGEYSAKIDKLLSDDAIKHLTELGFEIRPIGENSMDEGFKHCGYEILW